MELLRQRKKCLLVTSSLKNVEGIGSFCQPNCRSSVGAETDIPSNVPTRLCSLQKLHSCKSTECCLNLWSRQVEYFTKVKIQGLSGPLRIVVDLDLYSTNRHHTLFFSECFITNCVPFNFPLNLIQLP